MSDQHVVDVEAGMEKASSEKVELPQNAGVESAAKAADEAVPQDDDGDFEIADMSIDEALAHLKTSEAGLSSPEITARLEQYGPNALPDVKENKCLKFLSFMWNPLSWVMEAAAIVAIAFYNGPSPWMRGNPDGLPATLPPDYPDFIGIILLLIVNASIGYYEESQAGDAVAALMDQLAPECKVKRDGEWQTIQAKELVPGDVITIKLGDIIPADIKLLDGEPLKVDQSGLTGECLPVTKAPGDVCYSGTVVKRGEIDAIVYATGINTFFGKAANLVANTDESGHLQAVLTKIGNFCLAYISVWVLLLIIVLSAAYNWYYRGIISMILVVLIGGIPIAMPTVLSVTLALGVNDLAEKDAIVTRITAIEELAGVDILCSDKTGTLTLNQLTVDPPKCYGGFSAAQAIRAAALSAKRVGDPDAIDKSITQAARDHGVPLDEEWEEKRFIPFNPTDKRTEAKCQKKGTGEIMFFSKGAPQVIIDMAHNADEIREGLEKDINDFALRGLRTIGVGQKAGEDGQWEFVALIPLLDPPRHDTKKTIEAAVRLGVDVKMITGDQVAIGKETAARLGMGLNFHNAKVVREEMVDGVPVADIIEQADGFGEVFPEDKYAVVQTLRGINNGPFGGPHVVGMTGDGVNDAPALKVADVGIAVADATDAARAAADIVLLTPGLHVIIDALIQSRKVFQRMKNYSMYAIATTVRIVTTFSLMALIWQLNFPPFLVLIIAFLNDGTILTISKDRAQPSPTPDAWRLKEIFAMGSLLGGWLVISTLILVFLEINTNFFEDTFGVEPLIKADKLCTYSGSNVYAEQNDCLSAYQETYGFNRHSGMLNMLVYLQVSITGQMVIFSTRSRLFFFQDRPSYWLMGAFVVAQLVATLIALFADFGVVATAVPISGGWVAIVWVWSIIWYLPVDLVKLAGYSMFHGNPWAAATANREMLHLAINGGASHMSKRSKAGNSKASTLGSKRQASRASAARASRRRASKARTQGN